MPTFEEIYAQHADLYDALVSREDYLDNLLPAIEQAHPLRDAVVVEFGAGTGRLTRLIAPHVRRIFAFDLSPHMLGFAAGTLRPHGNVTFAVADNRVMPLPDRCADIAIAGWSFGHATEWYAGNWHTQIRVAMGEMRRLLRPGGTAIILETMTTGSETPAPPTPALADYYGWIEGEHGFRTQTIRTDYRFDSNAEAERLTRFFFGDAFGDQVAAAQTAVVPECTGVWWKTID